MSDDSMKQFEPDIRASIEINGGLYLRIAAHAAQSRPPRSAEVWIERILEEALDARPRRRVVYQWPPAREERTK